MEELNQKANYDVASISGKVVDIHDIINRAKKLSEIDKPFISILANKFDSKKFEAQSSIRTFG